MCECMREILETNETLFMIRDAIAGVLDADCPVICSPDNDYCHCLMEAEAVVSVLKNAMIRKKAS